MKKSFLFLLCALCCCCSTARTDNYSVAQNMFGQILNFKDIPTDVLSKLDKMGVNDSMLLNLQESLYFNCIFEKSRNDFDFTGKKLVLFQAVVVKSKVTKESILNKRKTDIFTIMHLMAVHYTCLMKNKRKNLEAMTPLLFIGVSLFCL